MATKPIPVRSPCVSIAVAIGRVGEAIFAAEKMPQSPAQASVIKGLEEQLGALETEYSHCIQGKGGTFPKIGG
jgi:hypothetical protein